MFEIEFGLMPIVLRRSRSAWKVVLLTYSTIGFMVWGRFQFNVMKLFTMGIYVLIRHISDFLFTSGDSYRFYAMFSCVSCTNFPQISCLLPHFKNSWNVDKFVSLCLSAAVTKIKRNKDMSGDPILFFMFSVYESILKWIPKPKNWSRGWWQVMLTQDYHSQTENISNGKSFCHKDTKTQR